MTRHVLLFALLVTAALPAAAAKKRTTIPESEVPAWLQEAARRPTPAGANGYVVLHDELILEPLEAGGYRAIERVAYRALSMKGIEDIDGFSVEHRADDHAEVRGWLLLGNGRAQLPDRKEDVNDHPLVSYEVFSDSRALVLEQRGLVPGQVVGYESEVTRVIDDGGSWHVFGELDHHTAWSRATLRLPSGWSGDVLVRREKGVSTQRGEREIVVRAENLAPQPLRELRPSAEDVLPVARFRWWKPDGSRGFPDWNAVARFYNGLEDPMLERMGDAVKVADRLKPESADALLPAIGRAFDYAAREVRYVAIEVGIGGFQPHAPADVVRHAYGDCKDKAALLRSILGRWGLRTAGVSVRTRHRGDLDVDAPMSNVFDHEVAAVILPEGAGRDLWSVVDVPGAGRVLFLDATASGNSPWDLPEMDQGTIALVQFHEGAKLVRLPVQPPSASRRTTTLHARVDAGGALRDAVFEQTWTGNQAADMRDALRSEGVEVRTRSTVEFLAGLFPGAAVLERTIDGLDEIGGPLTFHAKLDGGAFVKPIGPLGVVEPGRVGGRVISATLPPLGITWAVEFGAAFGDRVEVDLELPAGWHPESLPPPWRIATAEVDAEASWSFTGGHLLFQRDVRLKSPRVEPERWKDFRDAATRINAADTMSVVLLK